MNIDKQVFGQLPDGRDVHIFTLTNSRGMAVEIMNYGAIITAIRVPDRHNEPGDVVMGFDTLASYLEGHPYFGAICGRVCNRIGNARFEIDGKIFHLTANEGENQLHGGQVGFDKQLWSASTRKTLEQISLVLALESPDGEEGFPGNLLVEVEYSLNEENELGIRIRAKSDKATHVNLTNHSYFNLNGCRGNVHGHELFIDAGSICELNDASIPTGRILPVEGSPYDFRVSATLGKRIGDIEPGYDINYVLAMQSRELTRVAAVRDPESGRIMEVLTTLPGLQLYTGNHLDHMLGKEGLYYEKHGAVCLETQYFPDACNQAAFPSTLLKPGEEYDETTVYRFSK